MDPDVCPGRKRGLELIPELRRLITEIPVAMLIARGKIAFFRPGAFLVRPNPQDDSGVALLFQQLFEPVGFQRRATGDAAQRMVHTGGQSVFVLADDEIQMPFPCKPVPVFDHSGNFETGVYMQQREWYMPEKRLSSQP